MTCDHCDEEILPGERADIVKGHFHQECLVRMFAGSVGHQNKRCSCYGGTEEDPPGMTKRQAAQAAAALHRKTLFRDKHSFSITDPDIQPFSITCPVCHRTSHNANDVIYGYCGACHDYTSPGAGVWPDYYVIYDHPQDYADAFVVVRWRGHRRIGPIGTAPTLDAARKLLPTGMACLDRFYGDDPAIVECWL